MVTWRGGQKKGGALTKSNSISWGVFFQTLKTLGPYGTCHVRILVLGKRVS
jgi:hypothetical protein